MNGQPSLINSEIRNRFRVQGLGLIVSIPRRGSYLRLIDSCITQRKAQGPSRTCNESKEEEEGIPRRREA